mmetsp:Transcript_129704/g.238529  ORF Transcript_129704/g.238529 Transcript_129704/m.238529 type:complete len:160 (-) Transcript_129704:70-549(-)
MLLILDGKARYFKSKDCHGHIVEEGAWVCEPAMWVKWKYVGRMATENAMELIGVDVQAFHTVVKEADVTKSDIVLMRLYATKANAYLEDFSPVDYPSDLWRLEHVKMFLGDVLEEFKNSSARKSVQESKGDDLGWKNLGFVSHRPQSTEQLDMPAPDTY